MQKFHPSKELVKLAHFSKEKYDKAGLLQHNWDHIIRNIYRAEKIAATEENVDMEVLYAATMLHDIGATVGAYEKHEENSRKLARNKLPKLGFSDDETTKIVEVLEEQAGKHKVDSIEAKILLDADKLEKSSIASIGNFFKVALEWDKDLEEMTKDLSRYKKWRDEGFYTEKAREINDKGIQARIDFIKQYRESLNEREDFTVSEENLNIEI